MFKIKNHRLYWGNKPVEYKPTPNRTKGFVLKPEGVLLHDTASQLDGDTSIDWFLNPDAQASAHLLVHRDGHVTQLASFNVETWHAGNSSLNGRSGVNRFSVGVEIVNPGKLTPLGNGRYQAWFGEVYSDSDYSITEQSTPEHGAGGWMGYTPEQIETIERFSVVLFRKYGLDWIWPHWKVSPGRKVDTNPLFPLKHLRSKVIGRRDDEENFGILIANTNQRRWPSYHDNVIQVVPKSERVEVIRSGWYQNGDEYAEWYLIVYNGHEGWVYGKLIEL
jgi:N-acetylmuramoyl-L-alanine amidase